ncbi:MAG: YbaK/EbsC family protein [Verrucomicrobia bacterium]|nr:YbaK/EbsC family protein [Verrucomicrobiota bacterium]
MSNRFSNYNAQIPARLTTCLNDSGARYEILHEPSEPSTNNQRFPAPAGLVRTAVVRAGKQRVLLVFPSQYRVDLKRFARLIGMPVSLEVADDVKWLFPDCALGAIPPFGNLYGLSTYVDLSVARIEEMVFSAGTSTDSIRLAYLTYTEIVKPFFGLFSIRAPRGSAPDVGQRLAGGKALKRDLTR